VLIRVSLPTSWILPFDDVPLKTPLTTDMRTLVAESWTNLGVVVAGVGVGAFAARSLEARRGRGPECEPAETTGAAWLWAAGAMLLGLAALAHAAYPRFLQGYVLATGCTPDCSWGQLPIQEAGVTGARLEVLKLWLDTSRTFPAFTLPKLATFAVLPALVALGFERHAPRLVRGIGRAVLAGSACALTAALVWLCRAVDAFGPPDPRGLTAVSDVVLAWVGVFCAALATSSFGVLLSRRRFSAFAPWLVAAVFSAVGLRLALESGVNTDRIFRDATDLVLVRSVPEGAAAVAAGCSVALCLFVRRGWVVFRNRRLDAWLASALVAAGAAAAFASRDEGADTRILLDRGDAVWGELGRVEACRAPRPAGPVLASSARFPADFQSQLAAYAAGDRQRELEAYLDNRKSLRPDEARILTLAVPLGTPWSQARGVVEAAFRTGYSVSLLVQRVESVRTRTLGEVPRLAELCAFGGPLDASRPLPASSDASLGEIMARFGRRTAARSEALPGAQLP
jgi:hypothetical protein